MPTTEALLAEQFDDLPQQRDAQRFGLWIFLVNEILFFGTAFAGYAISRLRAPEAFVEASRRTDILLGTIESAVLLISAGTMSYALHALRSERRRLAVILMFVTAALATVFLALHGKEYFDEFHEHLLPGKGFEAAGPHAAGQQLFFFSYYLLTGFHGLHVAAGIAVMTFFAWRVHRGRYGAAHYAPIELTSLYWHFVDIVWMFLYPLIYLAGRS
jgi:cytochrome c oxidase subunit 3